MKGNRHNFVNDVAGAVDVEAGNSGTDPESSEDSRDVPSSVPNATQSPKRHHSLPLDRSPSIVGEICSERDNKSRKLTKKNSIVGTSSQQLQIEREQREEKKYITYEPTDRWWKLPLRAWIPDLNLDIVGILSIYNIIMVSVARYTSLCGHPNTYEIYNFCDDDWIFKEDHIMASLAVGLFLLMAFKTHNSYDRFWEARKAFGRIKEVCRDLTRQICFHIHVGTEDSPITGCDDDVFGDPTKEWSKDIEDRNRAVAFIGAFASATKLHLRGEKNLVPELGGILCFQDILNIEKAKVMPQFCLDVVTYYLEKQVRAGKLSDFKLGVMNSACIAVMADKLGTCERIRKTPIPLSYALHLRFFIIFWLLLYPLHLIGFYGWYSILLAFLVDYAVLGIESMACEIENPFGYRKNCIDLDSFCKGVIDDTQEILKRAQHHSSSQLFEAMEVDYLNRKLMIQAARLNLKDTLDVLKECEIHLPSRN